jgi:2-aminoadipate transaminase
MQSSVIRELLKLTERSDFISFAGGMPAPELFPVEEFKAATVRVLSEHGPQALQYSPTEGCRSLRELIARHTARYGIVVEPENILVTSASQQALDLLGKLFINPGDRIVVDNPTYLGALQAWSMFQAQYVGVPMDEDGMRIEELEEAMRSGPKFLYSLPNFQNPTGVTISLERRQKIIEVADHYGVPIIEDDPYGQLRFEGDHLPPLFVLDSQARQGEHNGSNVIYLSTFSKTLSPGIRLGWIVAPAEVIKKLVQAKQGTDLHTSTLVQMVAYEIAKGGFLNKHVQLIRSVYKERRNTIIAALEKHMPDGVRWTKPQGGLFIWAVLPQQMDAAAVLTRAVEEGVAFVPGAAFYHDGSGKNSMRLNFSFAPPEKIEEGIRRLGGVLKRKVVGGA